MSTIEIKALSCGNTMISLRATQLGYLSTRANSITQGGLARNQAGNGGSGFIQLSRQAFPSASRKPCV